MSAVPAASYLMDFASDCGHRDGERGPASAQARIEAAHASGFESGKAAAMATLEARLEEQRASFARQLETERQAWVAQEAETLTRRLASGLGELEARLAETTARVLEPVLRTELRRQAIAGLRDDLELLLTRDAGIAVSVAGPEDLLQALRGELSGGAYAVTYLPNDQPDVRITAGQTILETRLGAWAAKIEEAVVSADGEESKAQELVIIRRRSGGEEGGHHGGVWKIAYADFMTAMMAFFLVMWLINSTDKKTLTQVATYFNPMRLTDKTPAARGLHESETGAPSKDHAAKPQQGEGKTEGKTEGKAEGARQKYTEEALFRDPYSVLAKLATQAEQDERRAAAAARRSGEAHRDPFEPAFRRESQADKPGSDMKSAQPSPAGEPSAGSAAVPPAASQLAKAPEQPKAAEQNAEGAVAAQLEAQIKQVLVRSLTGAHPGIDVTVTEEGVLVSLTDDYDFGMFAIASAEPRPAMVVIMEKLARVLGARPERLVVRGHTDGRPYKSGTYDNWRLSTARAHMAYYMLVRGGIDEKRFERVEGHADRSLRVADDPEAAQNRRIEILLRKTKP